MRSFVSIGFPAANQEHTRLAPEDEKDAPRDYPEGGTQTPLIRIRGIIALLVISMLMALALACSSQQETPTSLSDAPSPGVPTAETTLFSETPVAVGNGAVLPAEKPAETVASPGASQRIPPATTGVSAPVDLTARTSGSVVQSANGQPLGVMVSGRGEVSAAPDIAILNLGVESFTSTVAAARGEANSAMASVMEVLEAREIPDEDIQTRHFRIRSRYTSREATRCPESEAASAEPNPTATPAPMLPPGAGMGMVVQEGCFTDRERIITGYEVSNNLTVKLRDLHTVGEIIDEVTNAGGDQIRFNGINFSIDDPSPLQDEALTAAINDAVSKAGWVAETAGVQLGSLLHISEGFQSDGVYPAHPYGAGMAYAMELAAPSSVLVSGGTLEVTASVQALFSIKTD